MVCFVVLSCAPTFAQQTSAQAGNGKTQPKLWTPIAKVDSTRLRETSGIVASRKHAGVFWGHGDSGTDPKLVAFDEHGKILAEVLVSGAPNTDWEDICADDQGNLYVGDIGNNLAIFPARYVYQFAEPDPFKPPTKPITPTHRWRYKFPDKKRFDCESLFWHDGSLFVIANVVSSDAAIYELEEVKPGQAKLKRIVALNTPFPTGAEMSDDGSRLVVCSYFATWVFELNGDKDSPFDVSKRRAVRYPMGLGAIEAACFSGTDVVVMAENGNIYRIKPEDFENQVRFAKP